MPTMSKLGKYEIRRELGRGAMGVVYEGYDPLINRVVAIKTIRSDQLSGENSLDMIARFRREAQAAGRLTHPNIVSIYEFAEDGGTWFIAMEFVKGRELKESFEANERFSAPVIVRIMSQILDALDYSHGQGVVHRDIKPANIFLLPDGTAKVADFGIAHVESSDLTAVGDVLGTPSYMSPEQIMGLPVDGRSDLFSAGVVLYQFLTGERPFSGSATTTMEKVLKQEPLPPSTLNVQIPAAMDGVVRKALAKRPDDRFASAQEFAAALRAAGLAADDPDATVRAVPKVAAGDASAARSKGGGAPGSAANSRQKLVLGIAAGVIGVGVAAGAWLMSQRSTRDATSMASAAPSVSAAPVTADATLPPPPPGAPAAPGPAAAGPARADPGTVVISAVGLIDPSGPQYQSDRSSLQRDLRADSKSQLVEKALGLLLERHSLAKNYDLLQERLLSKSGTFINTVVQESEPKLGKDGLMYITTQAVVNMKAIQKSLNQMSRDERIELIRASGDPRISVRIAVRDADQPGAAAAPSFMAENLLKERIKSFGFRTWSEAGGTAEGANNEAEFTVQGEARIKKLTARLEASGLSVTKYTLTSWTVKCIDRATGEEIYFNTTLPKGIGSWASEEAALEAIGARVASEFTRDFFLQHVNVTGGRKVVVTVSGIPDASSADLVASELVGLPAVIALRPRSASAARIFDMQIAGSGAAGDLVNASIVVPLNAKLGQSCFTVGAVAGEEVALVFDKRCGETAILGRLETNPPAALYGAPLGRQKAVIKNPDTLRKLVV